MSSRTQYAELALGLGMSQPDGLLHVMEGSARALCGRRVKRVMTISIPATVPRCPICHAPIRRDRLPQAPTPARRSVESLLRCR